jgi:hypothetical protein
VEDWGTPPDPRQRGFAPLHTLACHSRETCPRENGERESSRVGRVEKRNPPQVPLCLVTLWPPLLGGEKKDLGTPQTPAAFCCTVVASTWSTEPPAGDLLPFYEDSGMVKMKVAPLPSTLSAQMRPP